MVATWRVGILMAWWVWLGSAVMCAWAIYQLWRARTLGLINAGVVDFDRATSPISFWFYVGLNVVVVILLGGGSLLVAITSPPG
jgi:hypothetical protein